MENAWRNYLNDFLSVMGKEGKQVVADYKSPKEKNYALQQHKCPEIAFLYEGYMILWPKKAFVIVDCSPKRIH